MTSTVSDRDILLSLLSLDAYMRGDSDNVAMDVPESSTGSASVETLGPIPDRPL